MRLIAFTHLLFSFLLCTHTVAAVHTLAKLTATCARPHPPRDMLNCQAST